MAKRVSKRPVVVLRLMVPILEKFEEIHWYEAHGVGRKEFKTKRVIR